MVSTMQTFDSARVVHLQAYRSVSEVTEGSPYGRRRARELRGSVEAKASGSSGVASLTCIPSSSVRPALCIHLHHRSDSSRPPSLPHIHRTHAPHRPARCTTASTLVIHSSSRIAHVRGTGIWRGGRKQGMRGARTMLRQEVREGFG